MPDRDLHALVAQPLDVGALGLVGALHRIAEVHHHLGDAAHADAADADEMHRPNVRREVLGFSGPRRAAPKPSWLPPAAATFSTRSASRSAASSRPTER